MKNESLAIRLVFLFVFLSILLSGCEREIFPDDYSDIYGEWTIRSISGGFTGGSVKPNFDILSIDQRMRFDVYNNDTLISRGRIEIISKTEDYLTVDFDPVSRESGLFGNSKIIRLNHDTLSLSDNCADCYGYFFVRSDVYEDNSYKQVNKELEFLEVKNYDIGYDQYFTSVYFRNENLGFITTYQGAILKTADGGRSWRIVESNNDLPLNSIAFVDDKTGYAAGGKGGCGGTGCLVPGYLMLKTTDGGETWSKVDLPYKQAEFSSIRFTGSGYGIAIGNGVNLRTFDGGLNWSSFSVSNIRTINLLYILDDNTVFLSGINGQLFRTNDSGEAWKNIGFETPYNIMAVHFTNEKVGYVSFWNSLMKTSDGGLTWGRMEYAPAGIKLMHFSSGSDGVVFGTRSYSSGKWDIWDSSINILIDGKWYGDDRVTSRIVPYCLDPRHYFTITLDNKLSVIKLSI